MVKHVEALSDFEAELQSAGGKLVIVDFTATWCGPCKQIAPHFEQLAKDNADVVFLKVDVDEADEITAKYQVSSMPTFVFLKNGNEISDARFSGANLDKLKQTMAKYK